MGISLKPERLKRYRDIGLLLWKYGRSDLVKTAGLEDALRDEKLEGGAGEQARAEAKELAADLEKMGPTFIKLGQLLSTRADLLPAPYLDALTRLQDHVAPVPFEEVVKIVETELGKPMSAAFASFDPVPLAAASLGQVHHAVLPSGLVVAVKVQRPGVRETIAQDVEALRDIAEFVDHHTDWGKKHSTKAMLEEFERALTNELDYRKEASNLVTLARNLAAFERILVPLPVEGWTTQRVLTMDYVRGKKISPLSMLRRRENDGHELAEDLFRAYLQQILVDGFFHADPHPGNVFLTDDGRIALLDLGMVARIAPEMQDHLLKWILAISEGRGEEAARIALEIGAKRDDYDEVAFRRRMSDLVMQNNQGASLDRIEVGRIVLEGTRISGDCGVNVPRELTMLGKALLNLDHVGIMLDPTFDPNASIRRNAAQLMQQRFVKSMSPANLFSNFLEIKEMVGKLPRRINLLLENLSENRFEVKVDAIDEERLIAGLHKIANRITLGLILAALIIAAAMLMRVPTQSQWTILGYPGLAILLFFAAAGGGAALAIGIVLHDRKKPKTPQP